VSGTVAAVTASLDRPEPSARGLIKGPRPTMKDVAGLAGVSIATVSRVINGSPPVAPELAVKVKRAVELLGYRHNHSAGTLRRSSGLSASIGLIFEDVSNPFFSSVQRGVEDVARARSVVTFAGSSDGEPERERELIEAVLSRRVDGLIVVPTASDHTYLTREVAAGTALVFLDRPPLSIDADCVLSDNRGGADRAVTHLIHHGHRRIGFLGHRPTVHTGIERLAGYRAALRRAGLAEDPALVRHPVHEGEAYKLTAELLRGPAAATALFTAQNLITLEALHALHHARRQHEIALVGFDDIILAAAVEPAVTVVAQDALGLGRAAGELLFSRLDGYAGPARQVVLPTPLIARGSGELPPPD
jgi:LacI family transcriptional regulator